MKKQLIHIRKLGFILKKNGKLLKSIFLSYLCKKNETKNYIHILRIHWKQVMELNSKEQILSSEA